MNNSANESQTPRVGIFWKLGERRLILDWTELDAAGDYGDFKIHEGDHCSHWEKMEALGAVPPGSDYEESPRGRVVHNTKTGKFILYADACILEDQATLAKIMRHLQLPSDTELKRDSHYRCFRCLGRA